MTEGGGGGGRGGPPPRPPPPHGFRALSLAGPAWTQNENRAPNSACRWLFGTTWVEVPKLGEV
jgi:hypothetical protein